MPPAQNGTISPVCPPEPDFGHMQLSERLRRNSDPADILSKRSTEVSYTDCLARFPEDRHRVP